MQICFPVNIECDVEYHRRVHLTVGLSGRLCFMRLDEELRDDSPATDHTSVSMCVYLPQTVSMCAH